MESFKELLSSFREWGRERFSSPLLASFLICWTVINWRAVYALFSDGPYRDKISWIDTGLYPKWYDGWWFALLYPLTLSIFYVVVFPPILRWFSSYSRRQQHLTARALLAADAVEPITNERAATIVRDRILARKDLLSERQRFRDVESELMAEIQRLNGIANDKAVAESFESTDKSRQEEAVDTASRTIEHQDPLAKSWKFFRSDFLNLPPALVSVLVSEGIDAHQGAVLLVMRDEKSRGSSVIKSNLWLSHDEVRGALVRLTSLGLLTESPSQQSYWKITNGGLEALTSMRKQDSSRVKLITDAISLE